MHNSGTFYEYAVLLVGNRTLFVVHVLERLILSGLVFLCLAIFVKEFWKTDWNVTLGLIHFIAQLLHVATFIYHPCTMALIGLSWYNFLVNKWNFYQKHPRCKKEWLWTKTSEIFTKNTPGAKRNGYELKRPCWERCKSKWAPKSSCF